MLTMVAAVVCLYLKPDMVVRKQFRADLRLLVAVLLISIASIFVYRLVCVAAEVAPSRGPLLAASIAHACVMGFLGKPLALVLGLMSIASVFFIAL